MQKPEVKTRVIGKVHGATGKYSILDNDGQIEIQRIKRTPVRMIGKLIDGIKGEYAAAFDDGTVERWRGNVKTGLGVCLFRQKDGTIERRETNGYREGWPCP